MKLLPFLFLLSFACYGQETIIGDSIPDGTALYHVTVRAGDKSLEEKLFQYADECYNDSTRVFKEVNRLTKTHWSDGDTVSLYMPVKIYYYIHREPTFSGFIQWLKKQK